ncbi:hypothetical protein CSQ88_09285 [Iodobacter sp. BJB302]|nr:hypothetical protein CSQ88_09285 [Iodobacter sp. BJB302]
MTRDLILLNIVQCWQGGETLGYPYIVNKSQKLLLVPSAQCLGAGVPLDLPFLRRQETKPKKATPKTRRPLAVDNRGGVNSTRFAQTRIDDYPAPLVPRSACFQGDLKSPVLTE